jgi:hypothetical protein
MATSVKNLTKMGTDVRKIAALLRAKAPEGHILAYISPEEAQLLKDRGGSGQPHADTGIPSFELADDLDISGAVPATEPETRTGYEGAVTGDFGGAPTGGIQPQEAPPLPSYTGAPDVAVPTGRAEPLATPTTAALTTRPEAFDMDQPAKAAGTAPLQAPKTRGIEDILGSKLGVAGVTGLLGALQARKASQAGQQGAADIQKLATPYQQTGQQLQAQAQAGQLTPAGQQSLQALQAQVAQGVQARGGVGVAQAQAAVEQLRQQLLQQQYDYGLKLSGIGDNIAIGAIKTGMQADQYANQLTSTYFNNIARIAAGTPTATTPGV